MKIGLAKERLFGEKRVALMPSEIGQITERHELYVEAGSGLGVYAGDVDYEKLGAHITSDILEIYSKDIVVKIKSPSREEFTMLGDNIIFSMLHTEQNPETLDLLRSRNARGVQIESLVNEHGERCIDSTDIAGEQGMLMAFQRHSKSPSEISVLHLGYGRVGTGAIRISNQLGSKVKILRKSEYSNIRHHLSGKDIVVNAISWPKYKREKKEYVITRDMLELLNPGAIVLDLSVDFPNPIETCRPTQLNNPVYYVDGIEHICIYGYPGLAPVSSSRRYSRQIAPIVLSIADKGLDDAPTYVRDAIVPKVLG